MEDHGVKDENAKKWIKLHDLENIYNIFGSKFLFQMVKSWKIISVYCSCLDPLRRKCDTDKKQIMLTDPKHYNQTTYNSITEQNFIILS